MSDILVTLRDIDDARQTLGACLNYFTALDIAERHRHLTVQGDSAITQELDRLVKRFDGLMGDALLQQHEAELEEEEEVELEVDLEDEDEDEEPSGTPFGSFEVPAQKGRRVSAKELREREVGKLEEGEVFEDA